MERYFHEVVVFRDLINILLHKNAIRVESKIAVIATRLLLPCFELHPQGCRELERHTRIREWLAAGNAEVSDSGIPKVHGRHDEHAVPFILYGDNGCGSAPIVASCLAEGTAMVAARGGRNSD